MALRAFIKKVSAHKCYYKALCLYRFFTAIDYFSDYKINIIIHCGNRKDWGHAWLTRNGKTFIVKNHRILPFKIAKIGANSKFCYWITCE